jgi:hypothetical protein
MIAYSLLIFRQVVWKSYDVNKCLQSPYGRDHCQPVPTVIPKSDWVLRPWSEVVPPLTPCQAAHRSGVKAKAKAIPGLSVGILTHEGSETFAVSLATYESNGLFDVASEVLIYVRAASRGRAASCPSGPCFHSAVQVPRRLHPVLASQLNNRNAAMEAVAAPYVARHPGLIRILGDGKNRNLAGGIIALAAAANGTYFLFLERDFQVPLFPPPPFPVRCCLACVTLLSGCLSQLTEPVTCVEEQLAAGVALLDAGAGVFSPQRAALFFILARLASASLSCSCRVLPNLRLCQRTSSVTAIECEPAVRSGASISSETSKTKRSFGPPPPACSRAPYSE